MSHLLAFAAGFLTGWLFLTTWLRSGMGMAEPRDRDEAWFA